MRTIPRQGVALATAAGVLSAPMSGADLLHVADATSPTDTTLLVVRDPRTAVGALMAAWETRKFAINPQPPKWWGDPWSFALIDDWEELVGRPLAEVCARQWLTLQLAAMRTAEGAEVVSFEQLLADPRGSEERLRATTGRQFVVRVAEPQDPYRRPHDIEEAHSGLVAHAQLLEEYLERAEALGFREYGDPLPGPAVPRVDERRSSVGTSWHSASTASVPQLLSAAGASLMITTYKAGQVIIARTEDGTSLDTHLTSMHRPMGTAVAGRRIAVGAADSVVVYSLHDAGEQVPVQPRPDLVLVPKAVCFTGDVAIHDMAWDGEGRLWFVNTRFSCLSNLDLYSSFSCEWKPPWVSGLAAEDRCHLNGMAMVEGRPRYVTALGRSDEPNGWRESKGTGGAIVDITTDAVIAEGLCMPHSPRWHEGKLWFLESGTGALNRLDDDGCVQELLRLPGFTRGLAFIGHYALVGLSQVRESVFTGLPVTASADERNCGVWLVDTRAGTVAGFLRFTGSVTEIFDVNVIPARWPHIVEPGDLTRTSFSLAPDTIAQLQQRGSAQHPQEGNTP